MFIEKILNAVITQIRSRPDANAFCIGGVFYSFAAFGSQIGSIRQALRESGNKNHHVGLVTNDDIETYASIFAIWMEGLAYVPLHHTQPEERSNEIISQAEISLVLNSLTGKSFNVKKLLCTTALPSASIQDAPVAVSDDALAYILFTSGSTGTPKGVPITRNNLVVFMDAFMAAGFNVSADDRCLQCFDLTFDVSVQSFLLPLLNGACTYTIPHDQIKYSYVYGLMDDHQLTFLVMAPSMIRYLRPYFDEIDVPSVRYCILTAEASPLDLVDEWAACIPNAEILDFYGPTEATIYCTYYRYKRNGINKQLNGMLSIGVPMDGMTGLILDDQRSILPQGEKGELCIAGGQLTIGYWKNEEKNAEAFFQMEYNGKMTRFYKTGDLCYYDEEGDIMYSGRIDFQVKIQGYRIELGEIEHHARAFLQGNNAVAIPFQNASGNTEIALFLEGEEDSPAGVIHYLKSKLPAYMVPTKFVFKPVLPLNTNGKIDRKALKAFLD